MKKYLSGIMILITAACCGRADVVLQDFFDDGFVETSSQTNGGFFASGTGSGTGGTVTESGNRLLLSNARNGNTYGVITTNTVSWTPGPGSESLRTTWVVSDSYLKAQTSTLTFTWQSQSDFSGTPAISLVLDLVNTNATLNVDGSQVGDEILLDVDFNGSSKAFTMVAEFNAAGATVWGTGALRNRNSDPVNINFASGWSMPTFSGMRLGANISARSNNGLVVEFDELTVETIPEPAVISLIGLFGGGMIFSRRIFGRNKAKENT